MTEAALESSKGDDFLRGIKDSLATAYGNIRGFAKLDGEAKPVLFDIKVFTDNIVVAHPLRYLRRDYGEPELGTLLYLFAEAQARLAEDGFFLRGAITAGQHYQDDDIAYGDALLEAVDLNKSGMPPRLVIGASVEPMILEHLSFYHGWPAPHYYHLLEDPTDERLFVNYLGTAYEDFPNSPINFKFINAHRQQIITNLQQHGTNSPVWSKYAWLATYHNYICRTFASSHAAQSHVEADYEQMAYLDEAKHLLDYLVPLNAGLLPRPLDAERLQQRVGMT